MADRPVQAAGRWYAVMAAEYTGERYEPTFSECLLGGTGSWPEGAGYAAWQKAKLPRMRLVCRTAPRWQTRSTDF